MTYDNISISRCSNGFIVALNQPEMNIKTPEVINTILANMKGTMIDAARAVNEDLEKDEVLEKILSKQVEKEIADSLQEHPVNYFMEDGFTYIFHSFTEVTEFLNKLEPEGNLKYIAG